MAMRTRGRQAVSSSHEFESLGLWPIAATPFFVRRKRFKLLTTFGWFAVCAAGAVVAGASLAFAT